MSKRLASRAAPTGVRKGLRAKAESAHQQAIRGNGSVDAVARTVDERVREAVVAHDSAMALSWGGFFDSAWIVDGGRVLMATLTHDGQPELVVLPVDRFLAEYAIKDEA